MNLHHDYTDKYSRLESPVHRLPTALKAAAALLLLLAVVITPVRYWQVAALSALVVVFTLFLSRVPPGYVLKRILLFEPFVVVMALAALLQPDGGSRFGGIIVKSTISIAIVILLSNTTRVADLLLLLRRCRVPSTVVTLLALMYRYIFILFDEMEKLGRARRSRSFALSARRRWKVRSTIIGELFVRSTARAERVYAAMTARGWKA